jgi:hypothetical protein
MRTGTCRAVLHARLQNGPFSAMEARSFEKINAEMHNLHIKHCIFSLHGSLNAGEVVLLDEEFLLKDDLRSNVATILRRKEGISFLRRSFLVNFYVLPRPNDMQVPCLPVPRKRTYIGFPTQEVIQTKYVSAELEDRLQALGYLHVRR